MTLAEIGGKGGVQYRRLVVQIVLNCAKSRPRLCLERDGELDPCDPGLGCWDVHRSVVSWPPGQPVGPLREGLPMLVRYVVFCMLLVFPQTGNNACVHGGVVSEWWFDSRIHALGKPWRRSGPCVSWRLAFEAVNVKDRRGVSCSGHILMVSFREG